MILQEIKSYVSDQGRVRLEDIALHFDVEPEAIRGMLDFWVRKGAIRHFPQGSCAAKTCRCSQARIIDWYEIGR